MSKTGTIIALMALSMLVVSCVTTQPEYYNTHQGARVGAAVGAISGQIIGGDTGSTLFGAAVGTLLGAVIGSAVDQQYAAAHEADVTDKRIVYYDDQGGALEAYPGPRDEQTNCRKVTKRVWDKGQLVSETVEEICEGNRSTNTY